MGAPFHADIDEAAVALEVALKTHGIERAPSGGGSMRTTLMEDHDAALLVGDGLGLRPVIADLCQRFARRRL
jgi:hypothetical protein